MDFCKHRVMDKCKKDGRPCIFSKDCFEPEEKVQTNADRIRAMTDEELAEFLSDFKDCAKNCLVGKGVKECSGLCATKDTLAVWLRLVAV